MGAGEPGPFGLRVPSRVPAGWAEFEGWFAATRTAVGEEQPAPAATGTRVGNHRRRPATTATTVGNQHRLPAGIGTTVHNRPQAQPPVHKELRHGTGSPQPRPLPVSEGRLTVPDLG